MLPEPLDSRSMLPVAAVVWGPFPLRWSRLACGLALVTIALVVILVGLQRQIVTCARNGALAEQCEWQTGLAATTRRRFPLSAVRAVRVVYTDTSNKGHVTHWGQPMLDIGGRELALPRQTAAAADASAAAVQTFLREPTQKLVRIDSGWSVGTLVLGGGFALAGATLLYSVWLGRRRFAFTWDASLQQLTMQPQSPLGRPAAAPSMWSVPAPVEVEIQWEAVTDVFNSARYPGPRGGRLQVRLADGRLIALLPYPMPGYRVHITAAEQLRHLLRCPRPPAQDAARIAASYETNRPRLGPGWTGITGRIAATWLGLCCGSLLGIGIGAVLALLLGFAKASDNAGGPWFFGGMVGGAAAGVALAWRALLRPDER